MKKQLNEVKRLQKIAGILKENVNPEQEAQNILDDLSAERDPMELAGMTPEDALQTVEAYGHTGPLAQEIADNLLSLAQNF